MKVNGRLSCDNAAMPKSAPRPSLPYRLAAVLILLCAAPVQWVRADTLEIVVRGVEDPMRANVKALVEPFRLTGAGRLTPVRLERLRSDSETRARLALRPFGYYRPVVTSRVENTGERAWRLTVDVQPGPPVLVEAADVSVTGEGAGLPGLSAWQKSWPLQPGDTLNQATWEAEKQRAIDLVADRGFLEAEFSRHRIALDLERDRARLELELDTGRQAVMGEVRFHQDQVYPHILENLPRFRPGDPYDAWLLERFRVELWQAGYFSSAEIVEDRHLDETPPRVDLDVLLEPRPRNTWQGTIGVGSDTGPRVQLSWNRHLLSRRGDSFSLATGWQEHNEEYFVRANYRIPRKVRSRQFWLADALLKRENETAKIRDQADEETIYVLGNVDISDHSARLGRLRILNRERGLRQWFETLYAQYLQEEVDFGLQAAQTLADGSQFRGGTSRNLSLGLDYEMPFVRGQGFEAVGDHLRGWVLASDTAWGSDNDFVQGYLSARWMGRVGERWKLLARGEVGHTDAQVDERRLLVEDTELVLSVTELPNFYRFKAGGSTSVRGYGFESLSNNNIGSNNIVTASVEAEYRVLENWSVATFFDIGNAFNDWSETRLKKGAGVGVRWYSIAGVVRVDVAQALDLQDKPWRIHFTIGVSVL
jgi:translocation and assembly module TamA